MVSPVKSKENKFINILFVVMAMMMFLMIVGVKKAQSDNTSSAQERILNVIPIIPQNTEITTTHIGYIIPIKSVNVLPNVSGYIQDVLVEGGQKVKTGDVLAIIDQREYDATLKATKASTAKAQADLNNADVYYRRIKKAGAKAISATDLDNAKASYLSALASLEQAKAEQNKAQVVYDYTVLQSTIDGVVGNVDLTPGNYVSPSGGALFSIVQTDPIRVVFSISDKEYLDVLYRQGEKNLFADSQIKLQLANDNIYTPTGEFKFTDNMVDKSTGSISIYADFANPNGDLVSGSYVNVQINKEVNNGFWVKQNHVYLTPTETYIYIIRDSQLVKMPVKILSEKNGKYLISENFGTNDYLVIDKITNLSPNTKVKFKINSGDNN